MRQARPEMCIRDSCTVGEGVRQLWLSRGLDTEDTAAATAITMVFLGAPVSYTHLDVYKRQQ